MNMKKRIHEGHHGLPTAKEMLEKYGNFPYVKPILSTRKEKIKAVITKASGLGFEEVRNINSLGEIQSIAKEFGCHKFVINISPCKKGCDVAIIIE